MKVHSYIFRVIMLLIYLGCGSVYVTADEKVNPVFAWKEWKSIDAAIALRPLDGPEDILEKVEIIQDRVDELDKEKARLVKENKISEKRLRNLISQKEVLQDLADIRMGGDSQSRQRLNDLAERIRREKRMVDMRLESISMLEKESGRLMNIIAEYGEKARLMKIKEGGVQ